MFPIRAEAQNGGASPEGRRILILGNSIVRHAPAPGIGWYGNWGMAASSPDSDFVHSLTLRVHSIDSSVAVRAENIAAFEGGYKWFPLAGLDTLRRPDVLIIKLGENVDDYNSLQDNFIGYYSRLADYLDPQHSATRIIVSGFWSNRHVNKLLENYALYNRYPFVSIYDLSTNPLNMALASFPHPSVATHPSDEGMRQIATRIWAVLKDKL